MTDELTSEKPPEVETGPTLFTWDDMVKEFGDPLKNVEPPSEPPAFVEELDQTSVLDDVDTSVFLSPGAGRTPIPFGGSKKTKKKNTPPRPEPTPTKTNWPKLPD